MPVSPSNHRNESHQIKNSPHEPIQGGSQCDRHHDHVRAKQDDVEESHVAAKVKRYSEFQVFQVLHALRDVTPRIGAFVFDVVQRHARLRRGAKDRRPVDLA